MKRLVIFRPHPQVYAELLAVARADDAWTVVDVFSPSAVTLLLGDSRGQGRLEIYGSPLRDDDRVLFLGSPTVVNDKLSLEDQLYVTEEWRAALLTALSSRGGRIFGLIEPLMHGKPAQLKTLASIGWAVPDVRYRFRQGVSTTERLPEPAQDTKAFLVITPSGVLAHPSAAAVWEMAGWLGAAISATQQFLTQQAWPWAAVPIALTTRGALAFGLSTLLPSTLASREFSGLLHECWNRMGEL